MGEHESKQRHADVQPPQAHAHKAKPPAPATPSADQVDKLTAKPSGVEIGEQCVFGDNLVGSTSFCNIPITSSHAVDEADVRVAYTGPHELQIVSAPTKLRPDMEGPTGQTPLRLVFQPTAEGSFRGALTIELALRDGSHQTHHVLVAGRAHADGTPDWDQRDREAIKTGVVSEQKNRASQRVEAGKDAVRAMEDDTKTHPALTSGQANIYAEYEKQLGRKLVRLYQARQGGLAQALHRAENYKRKSHHHDMSAFAKVAIELASIGVGAVLGSEGKVLVELIGAKLTGEAFSVLIQEGVKAGTGVLTAQTPENLQGISQDDVRTFFGLQAQHLNDAEFAAQSALLTLHAIMFPMVTQSPARALAAVKALIDSIAASWEDVWAVQSNESSLQWIRYIAHSSMGGQQA